MKISSVVCHGIGLMFSSASWRLDSYERKKLREFIFVCSILFVKIVVGFCFELVSSIQLLYLLALV